MFCPHKNSYLQLVCAMNPRVINKAVDLAMRKEHFDPHTERPAAQRPESMQPSLYAPHVDATRAQLGFGRLGLRLLNRELHSPDHLVQLQALHTILDQTQISENAIFLINIQLVNRLVDLMLHSDPVVKEKVCMILTSLANYYQGRKRIMLRPKIIQNLMWLIMRERKELRYAAASTLRALTRDRCCIEVILKCENIAVDLLKMVKNDHTTIVTLHLQTLETLIEWDPVVPLKANAFQIMLELIKNDDANIVSAAMDCLSQLCKHEVGRELADIHDLTFVLRPYLKLTSHMEVIISAVGLLAFTTQTTRSKWRAKECCVDLTATLVNLCLANKPLLQLRAMQVLINLCDCPDIRWHVKSNWEEQVKAMVIRSHEEWDGTSETANLGFKAAHNYRTRFESGVETIKNDLGDDGNVISVHSYVEHVHRVKAQLLRAIDWKSYKD